MSRLGLAISVHDLPLAELCAARLDGELFPVDDCFTPVDLPEGASQRAAVLSCQVSGRLIAERMSAAWIYGVLPRPPARHELCARAASRVHSPPSARITVREVVIGPEHVQMFGTMAVTTPLRTITDIARSVQDFAEPEQRVIRGLMHLGSITVEHCAASMDVTGHLPNKRRALERIRHAVPC